jgi:hypothetical protein
MVSRLASSLECASQCLHARDAAFARNRAACSCSRGCRRWSWCRRGRGATLVVVPPVPPSVSRSLGRLTAFFVTALPDVGATDATVVRITLADGAGDRHGPNDQTQAREFQPRPHFHLPLVPREARHRFAHPRSTGDCCRCKSRPGRPDPVEFPSSWRGSRRRAARGGPARAILRLDGHRVNARAGFAAATLD